MHALQFKVKRSNRPLVQLRSWDRLYDMTSVQFAHKHMQQKEVVGLAVSRIAQT